MTTGSVKIEIPFDALVDAIGSLSLADKQRLLDVMETLVAEAEEEAWEQDPVARAELQASRDEIAGGEYVTLDEYLADQQDVEQHDDTKPGS